MANNSTTCKNRDHTDTEIIQALASVGADVTGYIGGANSKGLPFRCPMCSPSRRKKKERCLSVRSDANGYAFRCHHCGWRGGSGRSTRPPMRSTARPPKERPTTGETALRIWRESVDPRGTLVEKYLAADRRLTLPDEIAGSTIRFHPNLYHNEQQRLPGMVSLFRDIKTDKPCGIMRCWLDDQGHKVERKWLATGGGAAVKLSAEADVYDTLFVGEGVETCVAALLAGYRPVWALGSAGAIEELPVLHGIERLTILTENDVNGRNAEAVEAVSKRWIEAGREVFAIEMLVGKDFNDAWREVAL